MKTQDPSSLGITPDMITKAMDVSFEEMLDNTFAERRDIEGLVVTGIVTATTDEHAIIDLGMKSEGRVALREFAEPGKNNLVKIGDKVEVYIENLDSRGSILISHEKALREKSLDVLEKAHADQEKVKGIIFGKVKGGFTVDVSGVLAFLPGSQVDVRPIRDIDHLMNIEQEFMILKMDRKRGNLIVSRRAIMDESRGEQRDAILADMSEGKELEGVVKNITDYGAFIDLGGIDGLLHITDIAWNRINHPSEVLSLGQAVKVKVIRFNEDTGRVSLGIKQLQEDPWKSVGDQFPIGAKVTGKITNITEYGAFVELGNGIEGLIHVSEMSWTRKNVHPGKVVSTSQEVEVMVLEIDPDKRRISLGYKQCQDNPWQSYAGDNGVGTIVEGAIRSITDFGIFIGLNEEIDGLIHMSDISWEKSGETALADYKKGDVIKAKVLAVDPEKERISLGIKQLEKDPFEGIGEKFNKGNNVTGKIVAVEEAGLTVELEDGIEGFIKKTDISRDKDAQNTFDFSEGDEITAQVVRVSKRDRKVSLSVKAMQIAEEKEAVEAYATSSNSGAALGDALSAALNKSKEGTDK